MKRAGRLVVTVLIGSSVLGAALFGWSEIGRLRARARLLEGRLAERTAERDAARQEVAAQRDAMERQARAADEREVLLESQLQRAVDQVAAVNESLDARVAEIERLRAERTAELQSGVRAMPEGVRRIARIIEDQLRLDGHDGVRVLYARAIHEHELRGAELIERTPDGLATRFYRAERVAFELDREHGRLELVLRDGVALHGGTSTTLPEDGLRLRFAAVDGPDWEQRLPSLVVARGSYPRREEVDTGPRVDAATRASWHERFQLLLGEAGTRPAWRVARFRDVGGRRLQDALLLGFSPKGLLEQSAEVDELAVEVDDDAGTVSLLLSGGVLHKPGGDSTIPESGYRILLPGLRPRRAVELMLGMVARR